MLLQELLVEALNPNDVERRFVQMARDYAFAKRSKSFTFITNRMMALHPEYVYEGKMYRVLAIPSEVVENAEHPSEVLDYIRTRANYHDVISWSKDIRGVIRYHNLVAGKMEHHVAVD
jgi:predicted nucleotidyltransferase